MSLAGADDSNLKSVNSYTNLTHSLRDQNKETTNYQSS